jgi:hypothetical protein
MNKVMGLSEVALRLGWKSQQVTNYLNRAEAKGFPAGMLPKPFQRIAAGWLWLASDIEEYAKSKKDVLILKGKPLTPELCEIQYQAKKETERKERP